MRGVLISWAAAWPTITGVLLLLQGVIDHWPLALRTLLISGLMVVLMSLFVVPAVRWLIGTGDASDHR